jgi:(heptosyl)LPS beta-1,4-glucosyltransferase
MKGLSVAIITKNEEANIERCLRSVVDVADEIVVVDSGSTDRTTEICRNYPKTKLIEQEWLGFAAQKQLAVDRCQHDWVLSLDADEALSPTLQDEIRRVKSAEVPPTVAYQMNRRTNYCGQWIHFCGWYPDKQLRLFHRAHARWKPVAVHEHLVADPGVSIAPLTGDLLHYSYVSVAEHGVRVQRYAELAARDVARSQRQGLMFRAYLHAPARFLSSYLIRLGVLDGYYGFVISWYAAEYVFRKYSQAARLRQGGGAQ